MIRLLYRGASALQAQQHEVDNLAHDLANVNTPGYKQGRVEFADLLHRRIREGGMPVDRTAQPGISLGTGAKVVALDKDFRQGALLATGRALDVAISGKGFFRVRQNGQEFLTRNGRFHRTENGELAIANGAVLRRRVRIPEQATGLQIAPDGTVGGFVDGEWTVFGRFDLVWVDNPAGLEALGDGSYRETPNSGRMRVDRPGEDGLGTLQAGYLEGSNVDLGETMTNLMVAQRTHQLNARALQTGDELWSLANDLRR
ncbi:MAG TPA: flagellar hook-basal body protein [Firmicutes bacterium]|nr:flagellar hook-basal body protein [Bacillota bacterium]